MLAAHCFVRRKQGQWLVSCAETRKGSDVDEGARADDLLQWVIRALRSHAHCPLWHRK